MKKNFDRVMRYALSAVAVLLVISFASCSGENDEPTIPTPKTYSGTLTTTLPSMPTFAPVICDNTLTLTWQNADQTLATIELDAFDISMSTPMGDRSYSIGKMTITDVPCVKSGDKIVIPEYSFECMAGEFNTTGTVSGTLDNGVLTATFLYKPGSMPFDVQSVFVSK